MQAMPKREVTAEFRIEAIKLVIEQRLSPAEVTRQPAPGLIFHSDRGCQYASHEVRDWLTVQAMRQFMSGTGNCYGMRR